MTLQKQRKLYLWGGILALVAAGLLWTSEVLEGRSYVRSLLNQSGPVFAAVFLFWLANNVKKKLD